MLNLQNPLAHGRTADIYLWDDTHILKLFHHWFPLEDIQYEQAMARAVHASQVKAPAAGEIVQVENRNGLIYERVAGTSMLTLIMQRPWKILGYARQLARLHAQMHSDVFNGEVPVQRRKIQHKIDHADALTPSIKRKLSDTLNSLPEGDRLCHGDFHPANVLIDGNTENIIDWIDASRGNPLADVARTSVLALGVAETMQTSNLAMKAFTKLLHATYLRHYFHLRPGGEAEYRRWLPIVAGARLSENIPELETWLVQKASNL